MQRPSTTISKPTSTELRGLAAIQYASQNPGTTLLRRALLSGRVEPVSLDVAYWLSQRGADAQIFIAPEL